MTSLEQLYYILGRLESLKGKEKISLSDLDFINPILSEREHSTSGGSFDDEDDYEPYEPNYDDGLYEKESYGQYAGTYAQDVEGLSDDFINDALDGEPDAYWNID